MFISKKYSVTVRQGKAKNKQTVKQQAARLEAPKLGQSVQFSKSPVVNLPLFLPILLPPQKPTELFQHSSILDRLDFGGFESSSYDALNPGQPSPSTPDIDLTITKNTMCKFADTFLYQNVISHIIVLTVEDLSTQAKSSAMGTQHHSKHKGIDRYNDNIIYISD